MLIRGWNYFQQLQREILHKMGVMKKFIFYYL